jgi:hypothetical protein
MEKDRRIMRSYYEMLWQRQRPRPRSNLSSSEGSANIAFCVGTPLTSAGARVAG